MDEHIREPIHRPGTEIDGLFALARQKEASDVYLADGDYPVLKIHDKMVRGTEFRKVHEKDLETLFHNCLTETEQQQFADRLEVEFTYATETAGTLQVMLYETEKGIGAACRLVPSRLPALEEIGPPEALKKIPAFDRGLVLITGKANCQKSTTIASIIDHINTHQNKSIVTIEDPIRFAHESKSSMVFQREIGLQALNYPGAIRTAMRTDMDVIYFTEIDGPETLSSAMNAAESRLVISTSVSFGGVGWAIRKLFENYPEQRQEYIRTHLSRVLKCLIWQHPVPVKGHTNTKIAMEILFNNQKISDMIRKNALHKVHGEIQKGHGGMQTMHQAIHSIGDVVMEIGKSIAADVGTAFLFAL